MTRPVLIVDVETTSLVPEYPYGTGVIWELALIGRATGTECLWRMKPDLALADPAALQAGRYYERTAEMAAPAVPGAHDLMTAPRGASPAWSDPCAVAEAVARLLDGAILVAANPAFDAGFLAAFLRAYGQAPTWHYRLRDIGSMTWAFLQAAHLPHQLATPPIDASTDDLARALGINPEDYERHSARGDCHLVKAMLDKIEGGALWAFLTVKVGRLLRTPCTPRRSCRLRTR